MIAIHVFVFKMHILKIFQKLNHRNIFQFKEIQYTLALASLRPFFNTNTYQFMSFQGNVKDHVFQKQAWRPRFIFISYHTMILYARKWKYLITNSITSIRPTATILLFSLRNLIS